jgi:hypothetical protein
MKKIILLLLAISGYSQHFIGPKIGLTSTVTKGNYAPATIGELGISYCHSPKKFLSLYCEATGRGSAYRIGKGLYGLSGYASFPTYASFNIGAGKKIVALDGGVINSFTVWRNDKSIDRYMGEIIGGLRIGYRGKHSIEAYWHVGQNFTKTYLQTNFIGIQAMFKLNVGK